MPKLLPSVFDHAPEDPPTEPEPPKRSNKRPELSASELREGQKTLFQLVDKAFRTLDEAMNSADFNTAVRAALGVLDRTGFGPRSTVDVNNTHSIDYSEMSSEELAKRAEMIAANLRNSKSEPIEATVISEKIM